MEVTAPVLPSWNPASHRIPHDPIGVNLELLQASGWPHYEVYKSRWEAFKGEKDPGPMKILFRVHGAEVRPLKTRAYPRHWRGLYNISVWGQEAEARAGAEHPHALALGL